MLNVYKKEISILKFIILKLPPDNVKFKLHLMVEQLGRFNYLWETASILNFKNIYTIDLYLK